MSERMQEAALAAAQLLGLVIAGVVLYQLGQPEVGSLVIGAALGHAAPRRRKGDRPSTPPPAALLVLCIAGAGVLSGCGASAVGTQYQALRVAAEVYDAATDGAEAALTTQAAACDGDDPCLDALRAAWLPVRAAQATVLLGLQGWAGALRVWEVSGDVPALMRAAMRAAESFWRAMETWAEAGRAVGWDLPALTGGAQ